MKVPEKIYLGIEELDSGYVYALSLENNGHNEYIRKDALLERIEETRAIPHDNTIVRDNTFQEIINLINTL